jgi:sulfhydrogenase subunit alpha
VVHCIDRSIEIIESLRLKKEQAEVKIEAGEGVGVTEAPRGTLYHHYKINERGLVEYANIITPTTQNLKNIEEM